MPGSFFKTYPRHRKLISINKVYSDAEDIDTKLRFDWNSLLCDDESLVFSNYSRTFFPNADALVKYLADFVSRYQLGIEYKTEVLDVSRHYEGYMVKTNTRITYICDRLFIAMGRQNIKIPEFPGAEFCETYDKISIDSEDYAGQRVLIVGKGNSAFETADCLMDTTASIHMCSPTPIRLAWKTH